MKTRSGELLGSLLNGKELSRDDVLRELQLHSNECDHFTAGTHVMSPTQQLCLAALVIERVPRLARRGIALRGQVAATIAYHQRETTVHSSQPLKWSRLKSR